MYTNQIRLSLKGHTTGQSFLQSVLIARIANGAAAREKARRQEEAREQERRTVLARLQQS